MKRIQLSLRAGVTISILLALVIVSPALARYLQPVAVELISFELASTSSGVEIQWETATESDIAYFFIWRGPAPDGPHVELPEIGPIEAMGSAVSGHTYTAVDETAEDGQSYSYQLVELTLSNDENVVAEGDITHTAPPTPELIGDLPPTSAPAPTTSPVTGTLTPQPTANATTGSTTPLPTSALGGSGTPTPTSTTSGANSTPVTRVGNTLGPTPTRFSFTPRPPTVPITGSETGAPVVEAAVPSSLAQVTGEPYPAPGGALPTPLTNLIGAPEQAPLVNPDGTLSTSVDLPGSVGAGVQVAASAGGQGDEAAVEETSGTARLLLWLGFLAAFFIFIGGIGFSIVLSTRRRDTDMP